MSPLNVTECYALGDTERKLAVFQFIVPLGYLAAHRNEPIDLGNFPPGPASGAAFGDGGIAYGPVRRETLTVSQVSTVERAYVGRLRSWVEFSRSPDGGDVIACSGEGPFWTVPGFFY
jgi:hypothetical protein